MFYDESLLHRSETSLCFTAIIFFAGQSRLRVSRRVSSSESSCMFAPFSSFAILGQIDRPNVALMHVTRVRPPYLFRLRCVFKSIPTVSRAGPLRRIGLACFPLIARVGFRIYHNLEFAK